MSTTFQIIKTLAKLILGRGTFRSYSQNGEDAVLRALMHVGASRTGVYVDVGAYHPILYSNTYAFYRRGWRGIVIDANADMFPLYRFFRPRDTFVKAGIGRAPGERMLHVFSDGAYNTFDGKEAAERKRMSWLKYLGERKVNIRPLRDVLAEHNITAVDLLSIDIEGLDMEALESYPWDIPPRCIAIESRTFNADRPQDDAAYRFLHEKGYSLEGLAAYTLLFRRANV